MNQVLTQIFETSSIATIIVDQEDRILLFNHKAAQLWQRTPHEVLGQKLNVLLPSQAGNILRQPEAQPSTLLSILDAKGQQKYCRVLIHTLQQADHILHMLMCYDDAASCLQYSDHTPQHGVPVFEPDIDPAQQERLRMELDLRAALRKNELHMHYQPQVSSDPETGLLGLEALARWTHPTQGDIPPSKFIALAEASDLIDDLAFWTLDHACHQLAKWRSRNLPIPRVAVNLSAANLKNSNLPRTVAATLSAYQLHPYDLTLEITESAVLHPDKTIRSNVAALHDLGILLSLDDFGTGYSSLSHLHQLPIQELKLDRSFISDLEHSSSAQILTRSILQLADSLGLHVVAEGVETKPQQAFLQRQKCNALQGYLISKPLSPEDLEHWIRQLMAL